MPNTQSLNTFLPRIIGRSAATTLTLVGTLLGLSLMSAPSAHAINAAADTVSITIDRADLETDRGLARIYTKLSNKAHTACFDSGKRSLADIAIGRKCESKLMQDFIESVNDERLWDYHRSMKAST